MHLNLIWECRWLYFVFLRIAVINQLIVWLELTSLVAQRKVRSDFSVTKHFHDWRDLTKIYHRSVGDLMYSLVFLWLSCTSNMCYTGCSSTKSSSQRYWCASCWPSSNCKGSCWNAILSWGYQGELGFLFYQTSYQTQLLFKDAEKYFIFWESYIHNFLPLVS